MFKWLLNLTTFPFLFDAPDDAGGGDDLGILGDIDPEDDKTDDKSDDDKTDDDPEEDQPDDDTEEETEEDPEAEEDDEEEDDSEEDDPEEENRVTYASDLKKAYPDIFKKFPDVKAALYRDQEYSELFGSPKDAQNIVAKGNLLDQIEKDLVIDGNPKELLNAVKKDSPESFKKIAFALLPYLAEADKEAYLEVAALPIKQLLRSMASKYDPKSNEYKAAQYVHQFFFENLKFDEKVAVEKGTETKKSEKELEYEKRIAAIDQRDQDQFFTATNTSYVSRLNKEFREVLDKDDRLSDWMKAKVVESGLAEIKTQLNNDPRFKRQMESLWSQAKASGYSNDLKSRIISTALARAKSLVPKVRAKLIAALGKKAKKEAKDDKKANVTTFVKRESSKSANKPKTQVSDIDILRGNG